MQVPLHGLGGAADLPIPAPYAIAGGTAALTVSFTILLLAWRIPRFGDRSSGRPAPERLARLVDHPLFTLALRVLGVVAFVYVAVVAVIGPDLVLNPVFGIVYVWVWVGLVPASLLFGRFYRAINPIRSLHAVLSKLLRSDPEAVLFTYPARLGYWPAALTLFSFVWLELVHPGSAYLNPVRIWLIGYLAIVLLGGLLFGSRWISRADPFEVFSTLVAHLSIWGRRTREDRRRKGAREAGTPGGTGGALVTRSPLANLALLRGEPGLVAVVAVLLGSTAYDSFRGANFWLQWTQDTGLNVTFLSTLALLAAISVVGGTFAAATMTTGVDDDRATRTSLPAAFAHSVVPIVVGYVFAHYLTYLVEQGQRTLAQVSDPLVNGSNLFGTADLGVNYWLSLHPTLLATTKVLAIVLGHVLGVIAAHDQALRVLPRRHQVTGQLPLLLVMVLYTLSGLYLLFGID